MAQKRYTFIDLFAGCGGLSEGFIRQGFFPVAHVEMNADGCDTIKTRIAFHYLETVGKLDIYNEYLLKKISKTDFYNKIPSEYMNSVITAEISDETIDGIFQCVDKSIKELCDKDVDMIIGGPPCQAFSTLSRHHENIEEDPRCYLYKQYGKFLDKYKPKGFVFENVVGILSAKDSNGTLHFKNIKQHFKDLGYETHHAVYNAADYGVLQNRKRVIIYGWRSDIDFKVPQLHTWINDWATSFVFEDLQSIPAGGQGNQYCCEPNAYLKESKIRVGDELLTQHITRPLNSSDALRYKFAVEQFLNSGKRISYLDFPEEYQTMHNKGAFLDRFKVVNRFGKSHTVVAHIAKDGHYYIYPYLNTIRSISVREAARLQSFPDNFYFEGSRSAIFKQIGNAVPPLLAEAIAKGIKELLCPRKSNK